MNDRFGFPILVVFLLSFGRHGVGQPAPDGKKASFSMTISLPSETVKPGGEVQVVVNLTNASGEPISLWRARSGPPPYPVHVFDRAGKEAPFTAVGRAFRKGKAAVLESGRIVGASGSGSSVTIAPDARAKDVVVIENQFDLSQPGEYTIRLDRIDPATKVLVKSNTVALTVAN